MAGFSGDPIGGGSGGYGGGTGGQYGPLSSQTYYADPNAANGLIQQLLGNIQQQQGNLNSFVANPTASPLFQGQLSGLLGALAPDEQRGATNLQDVFRNAGNTSSSVFGDAAQNYQGGIQRNHQELASKLLGQSFQQIVGALLPQITQGPQLLEAMRLSQSYRPQQQQSGGGSTSSPTSSGGGAQPNNSLQQLIDMMNRGGGTPPTPNNPPPTDQGSWYNPQKGGGGGSTYYTPGESSFYNNYGQGWDTPGQFPGSQQTTPDNNWVGSTSDTTGNTYAE